MRETPTKKRLASQASIDAMFNGSLKRAKIGPNLNGATTKDADDVLLVDTSKKLTSVMVVKTDQ